MRINLYGEELTDEVTVVSKTVTDDKVGTRTFYGIRIFLKSPAELHSDPEDDDRSAVTFWIPWTRKEGYDLRLIESICDNILDRLLNPLISSLVQKQEKVIW